MGRRLASLTMVLALVPALPGAGLAQPQRPPAALSVEVDAAHPVLAGRVPVRVSRPAERAEILIAIDPQASPEMNRVGTGLLLDVVRTALPGLAVTGEPTTAVAGGMSPLMRRPYGGLVRVDVPPPLDDLLLRDAVTRLIAATAQIGWRQPAGSARIVSIGRGYASCAPFASLASAAAVQRVAQYAHALGVPSEQHPALLDRTVPMRPIDGPALDDPLCGAGAHATRGTAVELPVEASFTLHRTYDFAQRMQFAAPQTGAPRESVPVLYAAPVDEPRLRIRSAGAVLTLEGHAFVARVRDRMLYEYRGPNGRYFPRDVTVRHLDEIRQRLRALGVADRDITTQLAPPNAIWYVVVRTRDTAPDERIVAALAGTNASERRGVRATAFGEECSIGADGVRRATADAARARRASPRCSARAWTQRIRSPCCSSTARRSAAARSARRSPRSPSRFRAMPAAACARRRRRNRSSTTPSFW